MEDYGYPTPELPELPEKWKVKNPPRLSDLSEEERELLSKQAQLEALSEEDGDAAFMLEYQEAERALEKQRLALLAVASSRSSTPEKKPPSERNRSTTSSPSDFEE